MPILKAVRPLEKDLSEVSFHQHRHWSEGDLEPLSNFDRLEISYRETMSEGPSEIPIENLSPEEANRIIHSHRKVRYGM